MIVICLNGETTSTTDGGVVCFMVNVIYFRKSVIAGYILSELDVQMFSPAIGVWSE